MWSADKWQDYVLLDSADGEKLEYWSKYLLRRPDPQAENPPRNGIRRTRITTVQNRAAAAGSTSIKSCPNAGL